MMKKKLYNSKISTQWCWISTLVLTLLLLISGLFTSHAQTIWNAGNLTFTKTAVGQQDLITTNTHLTRGSNFPIYNTVTESTAQQSCTWTPGNTMWAIGSINNWNTLTYVPMWALNGGCNPLAMVGQPLVAHLLTENIYLQVTFSLWQAGGGNFTYTRTTFNCPLTPVPVASPASICSGSSSNLSVTSTGNVGPVTYTWNPGGLTGSSVSVNPTSTTIYTVTATDANCSMTATVSVLVNALPVVSSVTATPATICAGSNSTLTAIASAPAVSYCIPTIGQIGATGDYINNVTFNTLSNLASGDNPSDYALYPQTTTVVAGSTYTLSVTPGTAFGQGIGVWIDYNHNGVLTDPGEFVLSSASGTATVTTSVTIPLGAISTQTRMRVGCHYAATMSIGEACGHLSYGEYEDYNITIIGGVNPLTYAWSPATFLSSATTNPTTAINVTASTAYTVTATALSGCTATGTVSVTVSVVNVNCSGINVSCNGGSNGSASVTATGNGPFTYLWNTSATSSIISGLTAGTYCVTVTNVNGCTSTCCYTVTQPAVLSATATSTNASCPLCADGTVSISSNTGGTPPYSYAPSNPRTGLLPGNYCITVTDLNGCTTSACATVGAAGCTMTTNMTLNNNVSCFGGSNGSATVIPTGGVIGPFSYSWDNGNTNATANNLNAGNHAVVVTDNGTGCVTQGNIIISQPPALTASCGGTNVSCFGGSNGSASVTAGGGTPGYTYLWSTTAVTSSISGLTAGTYCVTVTDTHGCTATCCYTVTQPVALNITGSNTNVVCAESATGSVSITVTGGTPTYGYVWSNGATTQNITNVPKGTYTVTVTDANGCTKTFSRTVNCTDNTAPVIIGSSAPGNLQVTITGNGSYADEITWTLKNSLNVTILSGGPYGLNPPPTSSGLAPAANGPFTFYIQDGGPYYDNACLWQVTCNGSIVASGCVNAPNNGGSCGAGGAGLPLTVPNISGCTTNVPGCPPNITTTNTPGLCGKNVTWTVPTVTDNCATTLTANHNSGDFFPYGPTTVTYTAADGCGNTSSCSFTVTVNDNEPPVMNCPNIITNCNGVGTYNVTANDNCGTANVALVSGPASGSTFPVGVTNVTWSGADNHGNTTSCIFTVTRYAVISITEIHVNVSCNGGSNGSINITTSGGAPGTPFYSWSNGATTQNVSGLAAGTYTVTVTDSQGCTGTLSVTISQPPALLSAASHTDVSCFGGSNGTVQSNPSGGTLPYFYSWSNGATTQNVAGLVAGTYTVSVTDANGCTVSSSATVSQPPQLFITETHTNVTCTGGSNGSVNITLSGGTSPFSFVWSNGSTTKDISVISALAYFVTVTQGNGCTQIFGPVTVTEPPALEIASVVTQPTSGSPNSGAIDITASGGTPGYTYSWSNGSTNEDRTGLSSGTYTVIVTDANGCTKSATFVLTIVCNLTFVNTILQNASCYKNNGIATVTPSGGSSYGYAWQTSPVQTTATATGLAFGANSYCMVTDAGGCQKMDTVIVPITVSIGVALSSPKFGSYNISCNAGNNGSISTTVTGSTGPYTYTWSNGATSQNLIGLPAGTYTVTVTNGGCTQTTQITLVQPPPVTASASATSICNGSASGTATVVAGGGSGPYTYNWNTVPAQSSATATGLTAGTYTATVTDANGCTKTASATVAQSPPITVTGVVTDAKCNGSSTGSVDITPAGGTPPYTYQWSTGATTQDVLNMLTAGTYTVTVTDSKGCTKQFTATVGQPTAITAISTSANVSCFGGNDGTAGVTASGGVPSYTYSWNTTPAKTTSSVTGLKKGVYTVLINDSRGCVKAVTITITEPTGITITISKVNVTVYGGSNGSATANVNGGVGAYSYSWNTLPVKTTQTASGLTAGTYIVTVTDANGCTKTGSITITQPSPKMSSGSVSGTYSSLFPNPSSGMVTITFSERIQSKVTIEICNLTGEKVYSSQVKVVGSQNSFNLDLSSFAKGIYTVKCNTNNNDWIDKLVIQ